MTEDEARALLLTIDPLAGLAQQQEQLHQRLLAITPTASPDLRAAWQATADALLETRHAEPPAGFQDIPEQFLILVTCRDESSRWNCWAGSRKMDWSARRCCLKVRTVKTASRRRGSPLLKLHTSRSSSVLWARADEV